jgi:transposase
MYISFCTSGKHPKATYAYIIQNSKSDKGYCKKDKVKNLGRVDSLHQQFPGLSDQQLKKKLTEIHLSNVKKKMALVLDMEKDVPIISNASVQDNKAPNQPEELNESDANNVKSHDNSTTPQKETSDDFFFYGHLPILEMLKKFKLQKYLSAKDYGAFCHIVSLRCIDPVSKLATIESLSNYIGFSKVYTPKYYYEMLGNISAFKTEFIKCMNTFIDRKKFLNCTYDTTNFFFTIDTPDQDAEDGTKGLRKNGFSKENRPNPIIQLGLLSDDNGIPITYDLFPGNTLDCQTVLPILENYKNQYNIKKIMLIADAGMNTINNVKEISKTHDYIFRLGISKRTNVGVKKAIDDKEGWKPLGDSETDKIKTITIKRDVDLEEKVVITFKQKYYDHDMKEKEKIRKVIREIDAKGIDPTSKERKKYSRYFKKEQVVKGKKVKAPNLTYVLDEKELDKQFEYAGYYALITNVTTMTTEEMIARYSLTTLHEELFKILKSILKARPVYVWKPEHIEGHFLVCYTALTILKILEQQLLKDNKSYSIHKIQEALQNAQLAIIEDKIGMFRNRNEILQDILIVQSLDKLLSKKYFFTKPIIEKVRNMVK